MADSETIQYDTVCKHEFAKIFSGLEQNGSKVDALAVKIDALVSYDGPLAALNRKMATVATEIEGLKEDKSDEEKRRHDADNLLREELRAQAKSSGSLWGGVLGATAALAWKVVEFLTGGH